MKYFATLSLSLSLSISTLSPNSSFLTVILALIFCLTLHGVNIKGSIKIKEKSSCFILLETCFLMCFYSMYTYFAIAFIFEFSVLAILCTFSLFYSI